VTYTIRKINFTCWWHLTKVKVILRPTVSRPVCIGVRHPSGTREKFFTSFFCIDNCGYLAVGHPLWPEDGSVIYSYNCFWAFCIDNCGYLAVGHPLWREDGSVIYSYNCFWALPEQSLSGPSRAELTAIFYCLIWDSHNLQGQVVFISPRKRVAQLYPRALGYILPILVSQTLGYRTETVKCKVLLHGSVASRKQNCNQSSWD
jgi:hypothetical protein